MARDVESYVHRIGRTGRAGELGESITFWNPDYDKECTPALCRIARDAGQEAGPGARGPHHPRSHPSLNLQSLWKADVAPPVAAPLTFL